MGLQTSENTFGAADKFTRAGNLDYNSRAEGAFKVFPTVSALTTWVAEEQARQRLGAGFGVAYHGEFCRVVTDPDWRFRKISITSAGQPTAVVAQAPVDINATLTGQRLVADLTQLETLRAAGQANTANPPLISGEPVRVASTPDIEYRWNGSNAFTSVPLGVDAEAIQDVIGAMVVASGGTYNDPAGTFTMPGGGGGATESLRLLTGSTATGPSLAAGQAWNQMDLTISYATVMGGGPSWPNKVGVLNAKPIDTDQSNSTLWTAGDTAYVAGAADVASILGAYDSVCNAIGSNILASHHSAIFYGVSGHNGIGWGSYNFIAGNAARSVIVAGLNGRATAASGFSYGFIGNGLNNEVGANGASVLNGLNHVVTGQYSTAINGQSINISGNYSLAFGDFHTVTDSYALMFGGNGQTYGDRALHINARAVETGQLGDSTFAIQPQAIITTTNTADVSLSAGASGTSNFTFPAGRRFAGLVEANVIGVRMGGASPDNGDGNYAMSSFTVVAQFYWDGTNGTFKNASATAGPTTSPQFKMLEVINDLGIAEADFPELRLNLGQLRIAVTGLLTTRIKWSGSVHIKALTHVA